MPFFSKIDYYVNNFNQSVKRRLIIGIKIEANLNRLISCIILENSAYNVVEGKKVEALFVDLR